MKKILSKAVCFLAACALILPVAACDKNKEENAAGAEPEVTSAGAGTYVLNDFSTPSDLYQILPQGTFGVVSLNTDEQYIRTGSGSAKMEPLMTGTTEPCFKQRLISTKKNFRFADLSKATKITADVYNASAEPVTLQVAIEFSNRGITSRDKTTLAPGQWTTVTYKIYPELLGLRFDLETGMYIDYYVAKTDSASAVVFYVDAIRLSLVDEEADPLDMTLDEDEFCSFEKNYQNFIPAPSGWGDYLERISEMSVSADPRYTQNNTGMSFMVRSTTSGKTYTAATRSWYYVTFEEDYCERAGLKALDPATDKFAFWVCNASPIPLSLSVQFRITVTDTTGKANNEYIYWKFWQAPYAGAPVRLNAAPFTAIQPNASAEVVVDFSECVEETREYLIDKYCYVTDPLTNEKKIPDDPAYEAKLAELENFDIMAAINRFSLAWGEFNECEEMVFYLDNFRFIRGTGSN